MNSDRRRQLSYLNAMGVDVWERRGRLDAGPAASTVATPTGPALPSAPDTDVAVLDWDSLQARVAECRLCRLCESRNTTVFGVGSRQAELLIIGEAPGAEEDRRGEPFVGRAGKLLDNMLLALGLDRKTAYIANILKCRPPGNRDPQPHEAEACMPYLRRQIGLLRPVVILALGRVAATNLLGNDRPLRALRAARHTFGDPPVPVVVSYHPAYLLRNPADKRRAWQDLKTVRSLLTGDS